MYNYFEKFNINKKIVDFVNDIEKNLYDDFYEIKDIYEYNQYKVLSSFIDNKLSDADFQESSGYGYNDVGRDKIEKIYSSVFGSEDALCRQQIVSGTHAISIALFALTKYGDRILSINDLPYDTIQTTIGLHNEKSSLIDNGIRFDFVPLINDKFDYENIKNKLIEKTRLIMIQRSRGYSERKAFSIRELESVISFIKSINSDAIILVDNCYGEFVDYSEPIEIGADIICGSLIKNAGGGLVKSGGYICGKSEYIELCAYRLTTPGLGKEVGVNFNQNRNILQGLYFAPQIVKNSLKVVRLFSSAYNTLGFNTNPKQNEKLNDIVININLKNEDNLVKFAKAIQETAPVDSYVTPMPSPMPGYDNDVIMAAGNFVSGSSIELSCDAPLREPYSVFLQGGLSYYQGKLALMKSISNLGLL